MMKFQNLQDLRTYLPIPQDAYVGDVMPFVTDGGKTLELYYLYDTDPYYGGYFVGRDCRRLYW